MHTQRWIAHFAQRGHEIHLLLPNDAPVAGGLGDLATVHRYPLASRSSPPLTGAIRTRAALRRILADLRPDLLHAHYLSRNGWLAWLSGYHPRIVSGWGSDLLVDPRRSLRGSLRARLILRSADLVTVPSHALRDIAVRLGARPPRVEVVPFGVDTTRLAPGTADPDVVRGNSLAGRRLIFSPRTIRPLYRQDLVVRALASLPPDVDVVMPGRNADPATLAQIRGLSQDLGVAGRIQVIDHPSDDAMLALYRGASAVVSVPDSDGMPVSVLEAMAVGKPVVISDLPGPREALGPMAAQLAVPRGDAHRLAEVLASVLALPELERVTMGSALRERAVQLYDGAAAMERMERLYERLAGRPAGEHPYTPASPPSPAGDPE